MKWRPLKFLKTTGLALVAGIFVATLLMWVRSASHEDTLTYWSKNYTGFNFSITSASGMLALEKALPGIDDPNNHPEVSRYFEFETHPADPDKIYDIGWVPANEPFYRRFYFDFDHFVFVALPYWALAVLTGIVPTSWLLIAVHLKRRARRRRERGQCPVCGYDLRGSPGRCPECGAACKAANPAGVSPAAEN